MYMYQIVNMYTRSLQYKVDFNAYKRYVNAYTFVYQVKLSWTSR